MLRDVAFCLPALAAALAVLGAAQTPAGRPKAPPRDYPVQPVPFTAVHLTDQFWAPKIEINRTVTIPFAFQQCERTGRVDLFDRAATVLRGQPLENRKPPGYPFDDTDVYKVIEGASYTLSVHPDPKLEAYVDTLIAKIAAAQEPDGYIYTTRTIDPQNPHRWAGKERWELERDDSHELYNLGHLYEAAVAHYLATGKRTLLDVAIKSANLLVSVFGPGKRSIWPGHQITEMALARLYRVTGDERYLTLAKFLLDERGPNPGEKVNPRGLVYNQAQQRVVEQTEPVGHAVRATYMYSGMADVAALTGDAAYIKAIDTIWENTVGRKLYITGGIGASGAGEAFGRHYELPNMTAYNETCASIGMDYWNHRLFLLHGDAKYIDVMERTLYNGLISGVSLDGKTFFYPNPLESNGQHERSPWFGVACCPSNITRFLASVPGYVYAQQGETIFVNLYAAGRAEIELGGRPVKIAQETRYPWDGDVTMTIDPGPARQFAIKVRIPGWARNEPVPGDLYRFSVVSGLSRTEAETAAAQVAGGHEPGDPAGNREGEWRACATHRREGLRHPRPPVAHRRHHRAASPHAGAPRGGARERRGRPRPRRAATRTADVRRRMAGQPERPGPQSRPGRLHLADVRVPAEPAQRRPGHHGTRHGARVRREGSRHEDGAGLHRDSVLRVGEPRTRPDDRVASALRGERAARAVSDARDDGHRDDVRAEEPAADQ